jgi:hypothetical protein
VNLQNIKKETLFIQRIRRVETCREYINYLIKTLSIVAKQKVLLFTENIRILTGAITWMLPSE